MGPGSSCYSGGIGRSGSTLQQGRPHLSTISRTGQAKPTKGRPTQACSEPAYVGSRWARSPRLLHQKLIHLKHLAHKTRLKKSMKCVMKIRPRVMKKPKERKKKWKKDTIAASKGKEVVAKHKAKEKSLKQRKLKLQISMVLIMLTFTHFMK